MTDMGANSNRVAFLFRLLSEYRYSPAVIPVLWTRLRTGHLPNTREVNRAYWGSWNWVDAGDEWSNADIPGWKESIVEKILLPFIGKGHSVLEIGPGGGRWTEHLVNQASALTLVDVTPECIELCKAKFGDRSNVKFYVNQGNDLDFVPAASIERVWSFDVFVHILSSDVEKYVSEIARILKPGGQALVHHAKRGFSSEAWRSDMTDATMREFARKHGLEVVNQFESWGDGMQRFWPTLPPEQNHDVVTVLQRN